jgi:hypothetical protein
MRIDNDKTIEVSETSMINLLMLCCEMLEFRKKTREHELETIDRENDPLAAIDPELDLVRTNALLDELYKTMQTEFGIERTQVKFY